MFEWCIPNPEQDFQDELEWDRDWSADTGFLDDEEEGDG